jgi:hypothetical protein
MKTAEAGEKTKRLTEMVFSFQCSVFSVQLQQAQAKTRSDWPGVTRWRASRSRF